ncbi:MAG: hypothetical protein P8Z77_17995 [Candidatus Thiodiazotropha sp.]
MKHYKCRDCGFMLMPRKPTNRCPECGSLYLIPSDFKPRQGANRGIPLADRLSGFLLGAIFGVLTFVGWLLALFLHGAAPVAGKDFLGITSIGLELSLLLALVCALIGLLMGSDRLAQFFGYLWGTDAKPEHLMNRLALRIPLWLVFLIVSGVTVGAIGYLVSVVRAEG